MTTIFKRLFNVLKSYSRSGLEQFHKEEDFKYTDFKFSEEHTRSTGFYTDEKKGQSYPGYSDQIIEDLANFKLKPPSSLAEVKKARNQEIKKYHPDRFLDDPARSKTAKEIMQIYNASYSRLKQFFESHSNGTT